MGQIFVRRISRQRLRQILVHGLIEIQHSFIDELHHHVRESYLAEGSRSHDRIFGQRQILLLVADAIGLAVNNLPVSRRVTSDCSPAVAKAIVAVIASNKSLFLTSFSSGRILLTPVPPSKRPLYCSNVSAAPNRGHCQAVAAIALLPLYLPGSFLSARQ